VENLWTALKTIAAIAAMSSIIPLMIWGGTGEWRAGVKAWASWAKIMGTITLLGGGFGMIMAISEHGFSTVWRIVCGC
jgi:hypothetical protein